MIVVSDHLIPDVIGACIPTHRDIGAPAACRGRCAVCAKGILHRTAGSRSFIYKLFFDSAVYQVLLRSRRIVAGFGMVDGYCNIDLNALIIVRISRCEYSNKGLCANVTNAGCRLFPTPTTTPVGNLYILKSIAVGSRNSHRQSVVGFGFIYSKLNARGCTGLGDACRCLTCVDIVLVSHGQSTAQPTGRIGNGCALLLGAVIHDSTGRSRNGCSLFVTAGARLGNNVSGCRVGVVVGVQGNKFQVAAVSCYLIRSVVAIELSRIARAARGENTWAGHRNPNIRIAAHCFD